jgi:hypothetical protein
VSAATIEKKVLLIRNDTKVNPEPGQSLELGRLEHQLTIWSNSHALEEPKAGFALKCRNLAKRKFGRELEHLAIDMTRM